MQSKSLPDLCVVSYSDLNYDARSINFIDFYRSKGFSVVSYSISQSHSNENSNLIYNINLNRRFLSNWFKFIRKGISNKQQLRAKRYFASDLYSLVLLRLMNIPAQQIIYDSREIFSALGTLEKQKLKQKVLASIERISVKKVNKIAVSGELDAEYLKKYFIDQEKQFFVIKNFPKKTNITPSNYLREKFNIPKDKTILIYQGVILPGRGIEPLLKSLVHTNKYVFVIVGDGFYKKHIKNLIEQHQVSQKVFLHPQVKYDELLNITASADIGVSLIEPITFSYELALPNKLFEYIYAGIPVLVTDLPAMKLFVTDNSVGELVPRSLNPNDIIQSLDKLSKNLTLYKNSIVDKKNHFTYESQEDILRQILEN